MSDLTQVKERIETLNRTWENQFREFADRFNTEQGQHGTALSETREALDRLNAALNAHEETIKTLEARLARPGFGGGGGGAEKTPAQKAFANAMRYGLDRVSEEEKALLYMEKDGKVLAVKTLTGSDLTAGGALVPPPEYVDEIIKDVVEISPIRQVARVTSTTRQSIQIPKRTGTPSASWAGEDEVPAETQAQYGLEEIPTHELVAIVSIQNNLIDDSAFDVVGEIRMDVSEQFAVSEGSAFVVGTGQKKPEGYMDTGAALAETNNGHATQLQYGSLGAQTGLVGLQHNIKTAHARRARWALNRQSLGQARLIQDGAGNYIYQPNAALNVPPAILGDPYIEVPDMPAIGSGTYPISYGDFFAAYRIVDRRSMTFLRDPYSLSTKRQTRFVVTMRVGGQVVQAEALRKLKMAV